MKPTLFYGLLVLGLLVLRSAPTSAQQQQFIADADDAGDFAEFEDFDDDVVASVAGNSAAQQQPLADAGSLPPADAAAPAAANRGAEAVGAAAEAAGTGAAFDDFYADDEETDDEDVVVQDEDSEFEHFQDDEEFEGFRAHADADEPAAKVREETVTAKPKAAGEPKLTMAKVPMNFRTHWDSYWLELIAIAGLLAYFANYCVGRTKNTRLASRWLATHRQLLEDNFVLIGGASDSDAGRPADSDADAASLDKTIAFAKESESLYTLWCSGRTCCEGMLVELKMIKRQDLVAMVADLLRPTQDQLHIKVEISKESMDTFVFAAAAKRTASRLFKEQADLSKYCIQVTKPEEKYGVPVGFSVLSEIAEASAAMLDGRIVAALAKYAPLIDYIHISDQFSGPVQQEDPGLLKQPEVRRMLMCGFNLPKGGGGGGGGDTTDEATTPMLVLVFYLLERLKRYRLSKEGKSKADKNRARVEEEFLKSTSSARAEAAALRREEKRKQEKEKMLAEEDPEKQRRWEQKEQKRQAKKKQPKMKQLSIKAF